MKIAVNTRLLLKDRLEGIGWFTLESLKRITQAHPEHEFIFIFDRPYSQEFIFSNNITPVVVSPQARHPLLFYIWFERSIPKALKQHNAELFLSTDGFISLSSTVPTVNVIHDINFAHNPKDLPFLASKYLNHYFPLYAKKAKRLATVSEFSKDDIVSTYNIDPEKIDIVYNGANPLYKPLDDKTILQTKQKYTGGKDYFIFVGALHPRKNIARLLQAFDAFKKSSGSDMKLVIVGQQMFKTSRIQNVYSAMTHMRDVIFTGHLLPEELSVIMGSAFALTFVPYFEGFGIPIIEAMNCDVPVITSNITSMPEIAGDGALLVDPYSVDSIKQAMLTITKVPAMREKLIAYADMQKIKFTWDRTAEKLWGCIEKVIGKRLKST
ncbi:MAG: glycosyltransferase family 4 protein [Bacteroidia bacterium]|nr:glycosyltransferase family 4 protein [Bacteroidia bacterium]